MSRPKKDRTYYGVDQEAAVIAFLNAKTHTEKEKIYKEFLQEPINTMIDIIIRRYKLYRPSYEFRDLHADTLSFLIIKFDKFKPEKGKKSFSYFGTICKHYLYNEMIKEYKKSLSTVGIDDTEQDFLQRDDLLYRIDDVDIDLTNFIDQLSIQLKNELNTQTLSINEFKVGHALVKILEDWRVLFVNKGEKGNKNSTKFNKNLVLFYIRNITGLNTKEIRNSMKRFKSLYVIFKDKFIEE